MTAYAPLSVVILFEGGSPKTGREVKPDFRRHKAQRPDVPRRPPQPIPQRDGEWLRRLAERFREAVRVQHEAVLFAGRRVLIAG
jgi:hypothetical protein